MSFVSSKGNILCRLIKIELYKIFATINRAIKGLHCNCWIIVNRFINNIHIEHIQELRTRFSFLGVLFWSCTNRLYSYRYFVVIIPLSQYRLKEFWINCINVLRANEIATAKQSKAKPCVYPVGYAVHGWVCVCVCVCVCGGGGGGGVDMGSWLNLRTEGLHVIAVTS